jgi:hypothetical protein
MDEWFQWSKRKEYLAVLVFFFLAAVLFTWPLLLHLRDGIIGGHGDPLLNSWIVSWDARTIFTHPSQLFQGNILYPARDVLAYSEHLLTLGIISAPVYFLTKDPILSYNFLAFFAIVFSGFGVYLLVKELNGSRLGGVVAGIFFALCPYKMAQLGHLQMIFSPFLPFMLLYLYRFLKRGGKKNVILFGVFFVAQSLSNWHYMVYAAIAAAILWVMVAIFARKKVDWQRLGWVVAAVLVAVLLMAPFMLPYLRAHSRLPGFERTLEEVNIYRASARDYLRVLDWSVVYGDAPKPFELGSIGSENVLYPGVVILILAMAGLFMRRRKEEDYLCFDTEAFREGAIYFLILGAAGFLLAFGPKIAGQYNPFYMIPYKLGLLKFTRVPARFYVLLALALAVLGGYGVAKITARLYGGGKGSWKMGQLTGIAILIILVLELLTYNIYVTPIAVGGGIPKVYEWLRGQGDVRVIELPTESLSGANIYDRDLMLNPDNVYDYVCRECDIVYYSTYHWKKLVNGYSGYSPFFYRRTMTEMQGFPSQRTMDLLRGLKIDYLIWDWSWIDQSRLEEYNIRMFSTPGLSLVGDFDNKSVFRVEPGNTAAGQDMQVSAVVPSAARPGQQLDLGLLVSNHSDEPLISTVEDWQHFSLAFMDSSGNTAFSEDGTYRPPFLIDKGETISLSLPAAKTPSPGNYTARLQLEGGVLGDHSFDLPIEIKEMPDSKEPAGMKGNVALAGEVSTIPSPDGLDPFMTARVTNSGDTEWLSLLQNQDYSIPAGDVHLAMQWSDATGNTWEQQGATIPSDVAPGQSVDVPVLTRPPNVPGSYRLDVGLFLEGSGYFGERLSVNVQVQRPAE